MPVTTNTPVFEFRRVYATNVTTGSYANRDDLIALPTLDNDGLHDTTNGWIDLGADSTPGQVCDFVKLKFYANADGGTGNCRVYGLAQVRCATAATVSYTHVLLADYAFTASARTGVADGVVPATNYYADTITRTTGIENVSDQMLSPTGDVAGHVVVDVKGFRYVLIEVIKNSATNVNALYARM